MRPRLMILLGALTGNDLMPVDRLILMVRTKEAFLLKYVHSDRTSSHCLVVAIPVVGPPRSRGHAVPLHC